MPAPLAALEAAEVLLWAADCAAELCKPATTLAVALFAALATLAALAAVEAADEALATACSAAVAAELACAAA